MNDKSKYPEIDQHIAPDLLASNCHHQKEGEAPRYFDDEETADLKNELFTVYNWANNRKEMAAAAKSIIEGSGDPALEIEAFVKKLQEARLGDQTMKASKDQAKAIAEKLDKGFETVTSVTYAFDFPEVGRMAYYNQDGAYIYDRPMEANEQTAIFSSMRVERGNATGTDG